MTLTHRNWLVCFSAFSFLTLPGLAGAQSACHYTEQADLPLSHPERGNAPLVEGAINGQSVQMEINTGATNTFMLRAAAERQNLNPERINRHVQSVAGASSMFLVKVKDFAIGNAHATNLRFPVIEGGGNATRAAALVGDDFLLQYDVELNLPQQRVKLFRADHCDDKALAYWDAQALAVPMDFPPGFARPLVQVSINGTPVWAMISTGNASSSLDLAAARRLGLATDAPGVTYRGKAPGLDGEQLERWDMTLTRFAIGDETIERPRLAVIDSSYHYRGRKPFEMVLGRDFLGTHRVLLAQSQMRMYFTYTGGRVFLPDAPGAR